jgi:hypothetical protein
MSRARELYVAAGGAREHIRFEAVPGPHDYGRAATEVCHEVLSEAFGLTPSACPSVGDDELQPPPYAVDYIGPEGSAGHVVHQTMDPHWAEGVRVLAAPQRLDPVLTRVATVEPPPSHASPPIRETFALDEDSSGQGHIVRTWQLGASWVEHIRIYPERGIDLTMLLSLPAVADPPPPVVVMVGMEGGARAFDQLGGASLLEAGCAVASVDLRGTGADAGPEFDIASMAVMLRRHLFARRAFDLRAAVSYLFDRKFLGHRIDRRRIVLAAADPWTELVVAAVAMTDERVAGGVAAAHIAEWDTLIQSECGAPTFVFVPGAARRVVLDDVRRARPIPYDPGAVWPAQGSNDVGSRVAALISRVTPTKDNDDQD